MRMSIHSTVRSNAKIGHNYTDDFYVDIDECATIDDVCADYVNCINVDGSFKCECRQEDGTFCITSESTAYTQYGVLLHLCLTGRKGKFQFLPMSLPMQCSCCLLLEQLQSAVTVAMVYIHQ